MSSAKLIALDEEDLTVVSAHVQDALLKVGEIDYQPARRRLLLPLRRFVWEKASAWRRSSDERRLSVLSFDRVIAVKISGIDRDSPEDVLSLLAIDFVETAPPAGVIELVFAGGGAMRLEAECIEARLADVGGAWQASGRPRHNA